MHVKGGKFFSWFFNEFLGIFPEGFLNERIVVNCIDSRPRIDTVDHNSLITVIQLFRNHGINVKTQSL